MAVRPLIAKTYDNEAPKSLPCQIFARGSHAGEYNTIRPSREQLNHSFEKRLALPGYLDELAASPWSWGSCDCTMAVSEWIRRITGTDPLADFRETYASPDEARETVKSAGGFLSTVGWLFDEAGLARTQDYEDGDVAAVEAGVGERYVLPVVGCIMAIRSGSLWVAKAHRGIVARPFRVISGWRL